MAHCGACVFGQHGGQQARAPGRRRTELVPSSCVLACAKRVAPKTLEAHLRVTSVHGWRAANGAQRPGEAPQREKAGVAASGNKTADPAEPQLRVSEASSVSHLAAPGSEQSRRLPSGAWSDLLLRHHVLPPLTESEPRGELLPGTRRVAYLPAATPARASGRWASWMPAWQSARPGLPLPRRSWHGASILAPARLRTG